MRTAMTWSCFASVWLSKRKKCPAASFPGVAHHSGRRTAGLSHYITPEQAFTNKTESYSRSADWYFVWLTSTAATLCLSAPALSRVSSGRQRPGPDFSLANTSTSEPRRAPAFGRRGCTASLKQLMERGEGLFNRKPAARYVAQRSRVAIDYAMAKPFLSPRGGVHSSAVRLTLDR